MASKAIVRKGVRVRIPPPASMYDASTKTRVAALGKLGMANGEIERRTGVSQRTIRRWQVSGLLVAGTSTCYRCGHPVHRPNRYPPEYVYLLGIYLGDGHITEFQRGVCRLRIFLDAAYPGIVRETKEAIETLLPSNSVHVSLNVRGERLTIVGAYSKQWPCLFPQHGAGMKHTRPIELESWQQSLSGGTRGTCSEDSSMQTVVAA
jgi:hypothetical protein